MTPEVILFPDSHRLADYLVKTWIHLANEVIGEHGRFSSAFPGGRSPVEFYNLLSSWPDFLSDEHSFNVRQAIAATAKEAGVPKREVYDLVHRTREGDAR